MRNAETKKVQYIGRTNDPKRRKTEHDRDPKKDHLLPLEVKVTGLTKERAKLVEQLLISSYTIQYLDNVRREIAVGNVKGFAEEMKYIIDIFQGAEESELLSLMGR